MTTYTAGNLGLDNLVARRSDTAASLRLSADNPVRIAYCIDTMQIGGTELNALRTVQRIDRARFDIRVISLQPDGPRAHRYEAAGIPVYPYRLKSLYAADSVRKGFQLLRWLRRERIEILHCHDLYANLFAAPWGRLARVPAVITSRRWLQCPTPALEIPNRFAYRIGHHVLANSPAVASYLVKKDGVSEEKIITVSNFVDEEAFVPMSHAEKMRARAAFAVPFDAVIIGCIARLDPIKDHATLLRAMHQLARRFPRIHLVLVGDGETRDALEELAAELDIAERVHFVGFQAHLPNLHQLFEVSVLTSLSEGFPNTIVEAMAAGRPVVATAVGGSVDAVRPDTGILVPAGAPGDVASAIERLVSDDSLRARMGAAARDVAMNDYHAAAVIPRLEQIYLQLARARSVH